MQITNNRFFRLLIFLSCGFLSVADAAAVVNPGGTGRGPREYVRPLPDIGALRRKGMSAPAIQQALGTTGTKKVAIVLVQFPDAGSSSGGSTMTAEDMSYLVDAGTFLKDYYLNASYGALTLDVTYLWSGSTGTTLTGAETPYLAANSISYYGSTLPQGSVTLIEETLARCSAASSSSYDYVIVAHAGYGEEYTGVAGDIWSANWELTPPRNGFSQCSIIPARESMAENLEGKRQWSIRGVLCHEFGHQLGLPDLYDPYDTSGNSQRIGKWCLMDLGSWGINNQWRAWFPAPPSAFCRMLLGWIAPVDVTESGSVVSFPIETHNNTGGNKSLYRIAAGSSSDEYFLIHTSTRASYYDTALAAAKALDAPGEGLLIWHIDKGIIDGVTYQERFDANAVNSYSHRTTDLEEADTSDPSVNGGDATDPWKTGGFLTDRSAPYSGAAARASVSNISFTAESALAAARTTVDVSNGSFIVSGAVATGAGEPLANVRIDAQGAEAAASLTDAAGRYSFSLIAGAYTVTPSRVGYTFVPPRQSLNVTSNQTLDFAASLTTYSISGIVADSAGAGIAGAVVALAGNTPAEAVTDAGGRYSFSVYYGEYALSPAKSGYRFMPGNYALALSTQTDIRVNFVAVVDSQYRSVAAGSVKLVNNLANPSKGEKTGFFFNLEQAGETSIQIYSLGGVLVKSFRPRLEAGVNVVQWDGKSDMGDEIASGIYIVSIDGPGVKYTGKVCIVR